MKKLVRPKKGRKIAGVGMGLANYFKVDPTLVRLFLILTLIPGGVPGLLLYLICWIFIPEEK